MSLQVIVAFMPGSTFICFHRKLFISISLFGQELMPSLSPPKQRCLVGGILLSGIFAGIVLLDPSTKFIIDVHHRLELAVSEFRLSDSELAYCSSLSPSCRSLNKRLKDAWLAFNSGRKKNPLLLYKRYKIYLR